MWKDIGVKATGGLRVRFDDHTAEYMSTILSVNMFMIETSP